MTREFYKLLLVSILAVSLQPGYSLAADKVVVIPLNTEGGAPAGQSCPGGEFVYGFDANGNILCSTLEKKVFVTEATYTGDLGGVAGANEKCQAEASAAGLGGVYKAWVSDSISSPSITFTRSVFPYVTTTGVQVASDWTDLTDGTIENSIDRDANGVLRGVEVWTYTKVDGTKSDLDVVTRGCDNFTSDSNLYYGVIGNTTATTSSWTSAGYQGCHYLGKHRLYCFQQ